MTSRPMTGWRCSRSAGWLGVEGQPSNLVAAHNKQELRTAMPTPNPSIERTCSGSTGLAFISFRAKPALPPRAAHVKR